MKERGKEERIKDSIPDKLRQFIEHKKLYIQFTIEHSSPFDQTTFEDWLKAREEPLDVHQENDNRQ